jgi:hypothetical protein
MVARLPRPSYIRPPTRVFRVRAPQTRLPVAATFNAIFCERTLGYTRISYELRVGPGERTTFPNVHPRVPQLRPRLSL